MTTTPEPLTRERPNVARPIPNDEQPDERALREPDDASRKKAHEVGATDGDPEAQQTSKAVKNLSSTTREHAMPKPKAEINEAVIATEDEDLTIAVEPVDTDDNDLPDADASGDSENETPDENDPPETWLKGED